MDRFWSELAALIGGTDPMYDWQKDALMKYITKSPHPELAQHHRRPSSDILMDLMRKETQPGTAPPEVGELYNLGFGKARRRSRAGNVSLFRGFDPSDMLKVLSTKPTPSVPGQEPQQGEFEDLMGRLYHEQLFKPLAGLSGEGGAYGSEGKWRGLGRGQDYFMDWTPKQRGYAQDIYGSMLKEQGRSARMGEREERSKGGGDLWSKLIPSLASRLLGGAFTGGLWDMSQFTPDQMEGFNMWQDALNWAW